MIYRVTFGFEGLGQGWSETHAVQNASENPQDLAPAAVNIAQKRVTFLGREFSINAIRISRYSDDGATTRARGVWLIKQTISNPIQTVAQAAEPAVVALLANGSTAAGLAPPAFVANVNRTFCGAPPDDAVDNGGAVNLGKANLGNNFNQWAAALLQARYGWLVSSQLADLSINTISQNVNGTVEITVNGVVPGTIVAGKTYPARIRRVNNGTSPLNGPLNLTYVGGQVFNTQEIIGLAIAQTGGFAKVYSAISPFAGFANVTPQLVVGKHQRGRPFGSTPGRARRRIRG